MPKFLFAHRHLSLWVLLLCLVMSASESVAHTATTTLTAPLYRTSFDQARIKHTFSNGVSPVMQGKDFIRLGMMWDGNGTIEWQVRFRKQGQPWTAWLSTKRIWTEKLLHVDHIDVPSGKADHAQVRWLGTGDVTYIVLALIQKIGEPGAVYHPTPQSSGKIGSSISRLTGPFHPRKDWGAKAAKCTSADVNKNKMAIHHTAGPNNDTSSPEARMRQIQKFHQDTRGWCDIGYHLIVSQDGEAWEGRPTETLGAHAGGSNNTGNIGISYMGDYTSIKPNQKMLCRGAIMIDWGVKTYGIKRNRQTIKGHREYKSTSCPGDAFFPLLDSLVQLSSTMKGCGTTTIEPTPEPIPEPTAEPAPEPTKPEPVVEPTQEPAQPEPTKPDASTPESSQPEPPPTADTKPTEKGQVIDLGSGKSVCKQDSDCGKGFHCKEQTCVKANGCGCDSTTPLSTPLTLLVILLFAFTRRRNAMH